MTRHYGTMAMVKHETDGTGWDVAGLLYAVRLAVLETLRATDVKLPKEYEQ